jgi:hypothetical protein
MRLPVQVEAVERQSNTAPVEDGINASGIACTLCHAGCGALSGIPAQLCNLACDNTVC